MRGRVGDGRSSGREGDRAWGRGSGIARPKRWQRLGVWGVPVGSRGRAPVGVWGPSPQKPTLIHKFIVAKSRYFHYNSRNSTSRGLEVFRVFDEWLTTQTAWLHWSYCLNIRPTGAVHTSQYRLHTSIVPIVQQYVSRSELLCPVL